MTNQEARRNAGQGRERIIIGVVRWYLPDPAATVSAGAALAAGLDGGMMVTLSGELGSGKTTLVRGMLRALGWSGPVKSPSYGLVEHYQFSSLYFYHFDFYRFERSDEWDSTGFAEYFRPDAVVVVEWPERVSGRLRPADVAATLAHAEAGRSLELRAHTAAGEACLAQFGARA
ncbi:MAG TPA: tRNA (adenosine(37)-N6)-threonylcarbamoyltransferase complex ATPase subunit type 1 TsaE [Casimicrobiaceae bacterium]|nr:tRNA (adenosine(37)-N6)-threonylcarbamoyltransferase complex ATPase subunit type 1 TsaE [Casimicrobiaceae bacterium]